MGKVRYALVNPDNSKSLSAKLRARRWDMFANAFPDLTDARVLDLGGTPKFWRTTPERPAHVTTVNLAAADSPEPWIDHVTGDACEINDLGDFDIVFSNSLIEHVGGHHKRRQLADVVLRSAPRYWVQTPYRYFPVEPHFVVPAMQFLPTGARATIASRWHAGPWHLPREEALEMVMSIELIGIRQLQGYFPSAEIAVERFGGLPKSIIALSK